MPVYFVQPKSFVKRAGDNTKGSVSPVITDRIQHELAINIKPSNDKTNYFRFTTVGGFPTLVGIGNAIAATFGALIGTTINALTVAAQVTGFTIAGGTTAKTLTLNEDFNVSTHTGNANAHHTRLHAVDGTSDHSLGSGISGKMVQFDTTTILKNATNTDTEVADAVTKKHTQNTDTDLDATFEATFEKVANKDATGGYAGLTLFKINFKNALNTITSWFTNSNTVARTYTFPDKDLTVAGTVDLHTQGTDTALGTLATKNPPVDADLVIQRDSASSWALVTSTWTQVKAFLKTYFEATFEKVANKDAISGYAGLDASQKVIKDPANATATPTASKIPIADGSGKLDGWITAVVHTQNTDTGLGTLGTKNPPIDADKIVQRDSEGLAKSLLHMNGTDASTIFTDEATKTWTAYGNAQLDTAQQKFGTASGLFDGTGDYIDTPDHSDHEPAAEDFTVDCWVRFNNNNGTQAIWGRRTSVTTQKDLFTIYTSGTPINRLTFQGIVNTVEKGGYYFSWSPATNTWYHLEIVRNGTNFYMFVDGVSQTLTVTTAIGTNDLTFSLTGDKLTIGRYGDYDGYYFNGWIDEFRFSKGIARHTANFTPSTSEYSQDGVVDFLVTSTWTQIKAFLKTYFDTLYNLYVHPNHSGDVTSVADGATVIASGVIVNDDINASAAIVDTKLAKITTAGKVDDSALDQLPALGTAPSPPRQTDITNAEIIAAAGIVDTKLAQIATASKVSGAAITLLTSLVSGAGLIPQANIPAQQSKFKYESRSSQAASGAVSYTGYGFTPSALIIIAADTSSPSALAFGFATGTAAFGSIYQNGVAGRYDFTTSDFLTMYYSSGNYQQADLTSFDADGFTLTWTKTGTPPATTTGMIVLAFR